MVVGHLWAIETGSGLVVKNHAKMMENECIPTNSTIADAMRVVLPPHSGAGAKEM